MRWLIPVLLVLLCGPAWAAGGLDAGGGVREAGAVRVHDVLGAPIAGLSGAGATVLGSGLLYGVSVPTPVTLVSLEITAADGAVTITWSAPEDAGVMEFRLERAEGPAADFAPIDARFLGPGPPRYRDTDATRGASLRYRLLALLRTGGEETLGPWPVTLDVVPGPVTLRVLPTRPNPFRGAFELAYALSREAGVTWRLYDVRGALVTAGDLGRKPAGTHAFSLRPPPELSHGLYFLEVQAGAQRDVQKVVMLP